MAELQKQVIELQEALRELQTKIAEGEPTPNLDEFLAAQSGAVGQVITAVRNFLHKLG